MPDHAPELADRLAARERPEGMHVMHQSWDKLLFMHWEVPVETLKQKLPAGLHVDTFEGKAYVAITPLTIWDLRPPYLPAMPYFSWLHELNVRTYVYYDGVPGVWFFSLDANNAMAVMGARMLFSLPYFNARIELESDKKRNNFRSARSSEAAEFRASWSIGDDLPQSEPGSLEFFLTERYCLYAAEREELYRCRIHHEPWPLQKALDLSDFHSTVLEADGLPTPTGEPLLHCGGPVHVEVWAPERVAERSAATRAAEASVLQAEG